MTESDQSSLPQDLPVLPLRDVVVYPHMVIPLFVGRSGSMEALRRAMDADKQLLLLSQRSANVDDPTEDDLYEVGTLATILQMLKLPDGTIKVLVEGVQRAAVASLEQQDEMLVANIRALPETLGESQDDGDDLEPVGAEEVSVAMRSVVSMFEKYIKLNRKVPKEVLTTLSAIDDPSRLADTVAAHLSIRLESKQAMLETVDIYDRLESLIGLIDAELDVLKIEKRIRGRVKQQMEKSQREYYLNEQMKAIQKELGDLEETGNELDEIEDKIEKAGMPKEALAKAKAEFNKLKMMSPMAAEATVVRNYLDWMVQVPWKKRSKVQRKLDGAEDVLEADHYGLKEVKERILEYLAVQQRVRKLKGPILCLVGPPGVGKTSLGKSIAKATGREFARMSLGGVRDEAEIRGHRRTYIGSMPGRVVQKMARAGTRNPLFMLDELDKMSMDFRGDPSSALLEVLDPEQNNAFNDHYLEVDYDLSEVMFIATANSLNIPGPLLDRMEIIRIPGYTEDEKVEIASRYLVPKQMEAHGLESHELSISNGSLKDMIRYYTREAGVRNLERQIAKICRKVVKALTLGEAEDSVQISTRSLKKYLGVRRHRHGLAEEKDEVGQVTGLAWTEVGGDILNIESAVVPGKGKLSHTGSLGDVMQESVHAALTVVRNRAAVLGIGPDFHKQFDIHIHVPEGATPKDGPSAGVGMCTALVSALTKIPVRADVAMTGEITLRGKVLPIGGLKEKLLAAHRGGIKTVLIPQENEKNLDEIPDNIKKRLDIQPVEWIDQVLDLALAEAPTPLAEAEVAASATQVTDPEEPAEPIRAH